jgi:hypothetical protein
LSCIQNHQAGERFAPPVDKFLASRASFCSFRPRLHNRKLAVGKEFLNWLCHAREMAGVNLERKAQEEAPQGWNLNWFQKGVVFSIRRPDQATN